jgi:hypothetical protein
MARHMVGMPGPQHNAKLPPPEDPEDEALLNPKLPPPRAVEDEPEPEPPVIISLEAS